MPPRKPMAKRTPNGRVTRSGQVQPPPPSEVHRLRTAALAGMRDGIWGTNLGWLYLNGKLTSSQFTAGLRWASLAAEFSAAVQAPRQPRSAQLERKAARGLDPDSPEGLQEAHRHASAAREYSGALNLLKLAGDAPRRAVGHVCEQDLLPVGLQELDALVTGLHVLATYWGGRKQK